MKNGIDLLDRVGEVPVAGSVSKFIKQNLGILIGFATLLVFLSIFADNFLSWANMVNLMRSVSTNAILAIGVMLSIMLAGIDLTCGALVALSGVVAVLSLNNFGLPLPLAIVTGVIIGVVVGLLNGLVIAYTGIHPFVVTLAMQSICRGAAYLAAGGQPVTARNTAFTALGNGYLGPIPLPVVYMIVLFFLLYLLLNKTRLGRHIYALGGNPTAAKYSGINVVKVKVFVWAVSGLLSAFAGVVLASRMSSGQPTAGVGYETDAIAAAVIGGTSMYGGVGRAGGVFIGVLIIGMISNGLNLLHVNSFWQYVIKGIIIIVAVYFDMRKNKGNVRTGF
ncbi:ABC transporter permease [Bifidobacterium tsurumiense]|uniref:Ribose/xylose/arabinose/galactoside ABC-type transport system, permease component n=1 Tax=Bifidobacterium tsurumiense TaxID=356829 RepID=A0A087ECL2_9BIFI|nr:ABC transporter permease [Bifidobacterium tsurumiense]KFJ05513.1 Ribose/xylose/arabinose/galactoside ABC-type transport system, permease component [Bifidobacterium tsurumiense]MDY4677786.1 ABC transporter permease [Bifidobacterium tsurumiense]